MLRKLKLILSLLVVLLLVGAGAAYAVYSNFLQTPLSITDDYLVVEVKRGETLGKLAASLERQGVITSAFMLKVYGRLTGKSAQIKAGEFRVDSGSTPKDLVAVLVEGKAIQYSFTLIEGHTTRQMLQQLQSHPNIEKTINYKDLQSLLEKWQSPYKHPEGVFLPDTYFFNKGATDVAVLKRAHQALNDYLKAQWPKRDKALPLKSAYEALVLASIVEKETSVPAERPLIAGVFTQRLKKNMRLQTDPTVIYGIGESFDGDIRYRDLRKDTPYNTYTRKGLTPTPISLASREAINAALHPEKTKALYFVAKGDGSHYFSETLQEHNRAVRKYQLKK